MHATAQRIGALAVLVTTMSFRGPSANAIQAGTRQRWAAIDGCASGPSTGQISAHVSRTIHESCSGGAQVVLHTVSDGGHTWPGTPNPSTGNGNTTQEINASSLMWPFFQEFQL
jgi:poly(3-hydroxybutyrate) depolymerase